ncbi:helix-turn-helix domain-containing protein [Spongiivirga citrea]|uniref:Helix-turn-helix domain-containing protein n=1 Tax=Spongiivirga citrea TaxID=1481457 RepID=A0A6M0CE58_9FLAO|nr:AraC family transcriptional regulator [Spongiivirga citrea]NER16128.1 helix-turn-helix domain-containing protein [Spongiivirga citrea]
MKIQLETITSNTDRSFSMMYNPRLSDLFYWHFHEEYELVYVEAESGPRHVGDHISTYQKNDLVLIGSNIPHLNFDYGLKTAYRKVVVHLRRDFIEKHIQKSPELASLNTLFERSRYGIAFIGSVKKNIGEQLFGFEQLQPFQQYLQLLEILETLSKTTSFELLHNKPYTKRYSERQQDRMRAIYAFVDKNYHQKIELSEISGISNMTKEAFCRYFKKETGYTFVSFLNRYRVSQSKRYLMSGKSISDACYSCGFESLSYYNRIFKKVTNENPSVFRKRYQ